ncbi:MAG: aminotransferase class I/II-fold pyridoxal phosphate-dependent enzyme [Pseudomonadota bacterium]|nr:aminotransferase class I/II-fold pyridoxal phosphate-dependent enzyme [Pseudomonadota bacterium]
MKKIIFYVILSVVVCQDLAAKKLPLLPISGKAIAKQLPLTANGYNSQDFTSYLQTRALLPKDLFRAALDHNNAVSALYDLRPFVDLTTGKTIPTLSEADLLRQIGKFFTVPDTATDVVAGRGGRKLITALFASMNAGSTVLLPEDQYPVYQKLAEEQGINFKTYVSVPHIDQQAITAVEDVDMLVVTSPLSPHGRELNTQEVAALKQWLAASPKRRIILDTVYTFATQFDQATLRLFATGQAYVVYSLAKSWLLPGHLGLLFGGSDADRQKIREFAQPPDPVLVDRALRIMSAQPELPRILSDELNTRWRKLEEEFSLAQIDGYSRPNNGYFAVVSEDAQSLLHSRGLVGLPLSVFGSSNTDYTVLSALPEKREDVYYATVLSNFARAYDKYAGVYTKEGVHESTFPDNFFLLSETELPVGIDKAKRLSQKTAPDGDRVLIVKTSVLASELLPNQDSGIARYISDNKITIEDLLVQDETSGELVSARLEDIFADSLRLNAEQFAPFEEIIPRSISILPVAKACQACCRFCFSEASISTQRREKDKLTPEMLQKSFTLAKERGAERAVISGGGEPTLVGIERLSELVAVAASYFPGKVTLITNALIVSKLPDDELLDYLLRLDHAGLRTLAISHHHHDAAKNKFIMGVDIDVEKIARVYAQHKDKFSNLKLRLISVLQKSGVGTPTDVQQYIAWAASLGINEINFKELYVSTDRESAWATSPSNIYSEQNRVHLSMVVDYFEENNWELVNKLPWGSPIYRKTIGTDTMQVAAYTEPSVWWERTNGIARSWNLMSDGKLMVSLEDGDSEIAY